MAGAAVAFIRYAKNVFAPVEITARVGNGGRRIVKVVSVVGVNCVARQAGSRQTGKQADWRTVCQLGCRLKESLNPSTSFPAYPPRMSSVCAQLVIAAGQTCH